MILAPAPKPASEWDLFRKLLPPELVNCLDPKATQAAYTPWVVTWLLIYQRLNGNATLNDAVSEFILRFPQQALPDCKRVRERLCQLGFIQPVQFAQAQRAAQALLFRSGRRQEEPAVLRVIEALERAGAQRLVPTWFIRQWGTKRSPS